MKKFIYALAMLPFLALAQPTVPINNGVITNSTINSSVIGGGTPAAATVTTLLAGGQITSQVTTGTAPFVVSSTTNVANLNASSLLGYTWASPPAIGGTAAAAGSFTTVSASGDTNHVGAVFGDGASTSSVPSSTQKGWRLTANSGAAATQFSAGTSTGPYVLISFINGNGAVGSIYTNAMLTVFNTASDARLKTPLRPWSLGDAFDKIPIGEFNWRADNHLGHGTLAQELLKIYPEAVTVGTDERNARGELVHPWGIDYGKLTTPIIARVQEDDLRLAGLESKLLALEAKSHADWLARLLLVVALLTSIAVYAKRRG